MANDPSLTDNPRRWPHLEACYALALRAAQGFAPTACTDTAFTAARWGLHMGLALARLDPDLAAAVQAETDDYDLARDGLEALTFARFTMTRDVSELRRVARRLADGP